MQVTQQIRKRLQFFCMMQFFRLLIQERWQIRVTPLQKAHLAVGTLALFSTFVDDALKALEAQRAFQGSLVKFLMSIF